MKQRIRVVGIVRNENGVLILKRNRSRSEAPVFWELPTGKIKFGEQPEEAMSRSLAEYIGVLPTSVNLKDVITFLELEGASRLSNLYIVFEVGIPSDEKINPLGRYTAYKFVKDFDSNNARLDEASASVMEIEANKINPGRISPRDTANSALVYVDGASRGNPGPSGVGYCIYDNSGQVIEQGGEFIGFSTSRMAEYYAMRKGIERALELGLKSARFISDSLMVVNQLNGTFAIKNKDILPIYRDIKRLIENFDSISFKHVQRSSNAIADNEANLAIDQIIRPMI
ncbi:MAG: reverse transcriptase-like protein [Candidatus Saccharibacteria bacterium]|nr:reverse transcriptase-like protein [Candidatus Saccharibacteria bacterium]